MVIKRGDVWWAGLREPRGSEPGYRRPVVVVQSDSFNGSHIGTVIVAVVTSTMPLAQAPGNVSLLKKESPLTKDSVINVSQLITLDKRYLIEKVGKLRAKQMVSLEDGLRLVLSL